MISQINFFENSRFAVVYKFMKKLGHLHFKLGSNGQLHILVRPQFCEFELPPGSETSMTSVTSVVKF